MPILAKKTLFTTHYYDNYHKGKRKFHQASLRPTSPHRRNNPHPQSDFLEPRNIKVQDAQVALQHRVQRAVQDYVLRSLGEGNIHNIKRIMEHREYPQLTQSLPAENKPGTSERDQNVDSFISSSLQLLEQSHQNDRTELKRDRGNNYKAAAKSYGKSPMLRYLSPECKPLVDLNMDHVSNNHSKRTHTPPTPPMEAARRAKSVAYEEQVQATKRGLQSVLYRSKTVPIKDETMEVENENEEEVEKQIREARPQLGVTSQDLGPRMKSWIEGATEFEKDVAYNMLQTLNGGPHLSKPTAYIRPQAPTPNVGKSCGGATRRSVPASRRGRAPAATHIYVPPSPAPRYAVPSRDGKNDAQVKQWMKDLGEKLNLQEPAHDVREFVKAVSLPRPQAQRKRPTIISDDYRHENSHFMMTQPGYRRHFIIAPDWVSERKSHRRLQNQAWTRTNRFSKGVGC